MSANTRVQYGRRDEAPWQQVVRIGLAGGVVALLLALTGMATAFERRFIIGGFINTGQVLLAGTIVFAAYLGAKRADKPGTTPLQLAGYGVLGGLANAVLVAAFVLFSSVVNVRTVLVNASPTLFNLLTFGNYTEQLSQGIFLMLTAGLLLGLVGAGIYLLPAWMRSAVIVGIATVVLVGLIQNLVQLVLRQSLIKDLEPVLFRRGGLSPIGAILVFAIPFGLKLGAAQYGEQVRAWYGNLPPNGQRGVKLALIAVAVLFLLKFPDMFGNYPTEVMNLVLMMGIILAMGLNIVVGFCGLLDLGHVGFFAIGAYTIAVLTSNELGYFDWTFWQALPVALFLAVFAGVILGIPVLRMHGDYLAIVTLGFGEIIRLVLLSDAMKPTIGGAQGIVGIPSASVMGTALNAPHRLFYLLLVAAFLIWFMTSRVRDSRVGRAWMAIREDEDVAAALGVGLVNYKLLAFGSGAFMAGLAGSIFAFKLQSVVPQSFNLLISINALSVVIVGGLASVPGVIVGSLVLVGLPELLREFTEYRLWIYGALLIVMMIHKPEGFLPSAVRRRELEAEDSSTVGV